MLFWWKNEKRNKKELGSVRRTYASKRALSSVARVVLCSLFSRQIATNATTQWSIDYPGRRVLHSVIAARYSQEDTHKGPGRCTRWWACWCLHPESGNTFNINCWNEWTEGSYLEPDTVHGMAYLEAIREVFNWLFNQRTIKPCKHPYFGI